MEGLQDLRGDGILALFKDGMLTVNTYFALHFHFIPMVPYSYVHPPYDTLYSSRRPLCPHLSPAPALNLSLAYLTRQTLGGY